jgi:TonB-dependent SusC/RagA subfamily outer membrane receptor
MQALLVRRCAPLALALSLLLALVLAPSSTSAQTGTIVANVLDATTRGPLTGVQVSIPRLQMGGLTNDLGRLSIANVPVGSHEVRAEMIGRASASATVQVVAGQSVEVNLILENRAISLEGVVVTGVAAATPRAQLAFTVDQVKIEPAMVAATLNAGTLIQGRMPGAKVIQGSAQPGEPPSIQLRGPTSITKSQEPLIIIDGVISRGNLADIDPNDIENIEVVRGAAAASLYGSRAQAGVIEITTKRGANVSVGRTEFTLRTTMQQNSIEHVLPMSLSHEYRMTPDGSALVDRTGNPVPLPARRSSFALDDGGNGTNVWTSFQDKPYPASIFTGNPYRELMKPGGMYSTYASVSGNENNTQYRLSGRYQRDEGIVAYHEGAHQTNFRANLDQQLGSNLQISLSSYVTNLKQDITVDTNGGGIFGDIDEYSAAANFNALDPDGTLAVIGDPISRGSNPLYRLEWDTRNRETQHVMASLDANWAPMSWLTVAGNVSYDRDDRAEKELVPQGFKRIDNPPGQGSLTYRQTLRKDLNASITTSLAYNFGELTTRSRLRWLVEDQYSDFHRVGGSQFAVVGVPRLALLTGTPSLDSEEQTIRSEGFFEIGTRLNSSHDCSSRMPSSA